MTRPKSPGDVLRPSIHQDVLGTGDTCPMPAQQCHPASRAATRQPCGNRLQPHATKNDREVTVWACAHQPHGTSRRAPVPYVTGQQLKKKRDRTQAQCSSCPGQKHQASPAATSTMRFRLCHLLHQRTLGDLRHGLE